MWLGIWIISAIKIFEDISLSTLISNILRRILLKREETEQSLVLDIVRYPLSIKSTKAMSSMGGYFVNWKLPWRNSVVKNGRFELLSKSLWRKDGI